MNQSPPGHAYYRREIAPVLPPTVLDFHTHTWAVENGKEKPWDNGKALLKRVRRGGERA